MSQLKLIWIEVSEAALRHNVAVLRRLVGADVVIAPAVKGNAYGHGMVGVANILVEAGADWLSVALLEEAEALRAVGIAVPILLVGYSLQEDADRIVACDVNTFVYNQTSAQALSQAAVRPGKTVGVHIKIDTGMSRQGVPVSEAIEFVRFVAGLEGLSVEGIATHFATSDDLGNPTQFEEQLRVFNHLKQQLAQIGQHVKFYHAANSGAVLMQPEAYFNFVRPGLSVYGYYPSDEVAEKCKTNGIVLQPALSLKTRVAQVKRIHKGSCVSYGCTFVAPQDMRIAVLPVGYADGVDRKLSNRGCVLIRGMRAPIVGRVCMNIMMVDVSHIRDVNLEDEIVIIGKQGDEEITVDEVAKQIGTINYEVTTRLRESIERVYIE